MRTAVSLFAGVGGFDLALERAGVKVVASVEIDNKAQADSNRYKQMGNADAVPVVEWIVNRLVAND